MNTSVYVPAAIGVKIAAVLSITTPSTASASTSEYTVPPFPPLEANAKLTVSPAMIVVAEGVTVNVSGGTGELTVTVMSTVAVSV